MQNKTKPSVWQEELSWASGNKWREKWAMNKMRIDTAVDRCPRNTTADKYGRSRGTERGLHLRPWERCQPPSVVHSEQLWWIMPLGACFCFLLLRFTLIEIGNWRSLILVNKACGNNPNLYSAKWQSISVAPTPSSLLGSQHYEVRSPILVHRGSF
jgi:hypothetical protein